MKAVTYCKGCGLDKLFLGDDGLCDECHWEAEQTAEPAAVTSIRPPESHGKPSKGTPERDRPAGSRFISLEGIKPRPARWLWRGRVPLGVPTLVAGIPGQGKSSVCIDLAAKVTRGELPGFFEGVPSVVVVMSSEDMLRETIIPRLIAGGADLSRVRALAFADGEFDIRADLPELEALCARVPVRLVVLDPLLAFTSGDGFKETEVRHMLRPAQRVMEDHRVAIVGVMHLNKDVMLDVLSRVTHSGAFTALVRSILFVGADPDDEDELNPAKVLAHGKSNLSRTAPSLGFRVAEVVIPGEDEDGEPCEVLTTRIEWLGESEVTAEQLVKGRGSAGTKLAQAEGLLRRLCPAGRVTILGEAERLGISRATVERAFARMGGTSDEQLRDPDTGKMGATVWRLPAQVRP
jgi:hypothetical protein